LLKPIAPAADVGSGDLIDSSGCRCKNPFTQS